MPEEPETDELRMQIEAIDEQIIDLWTILIYDLVDM